LKEITAKLTNSKFGPKIQLKFPYDPELISKIKSLSWDETHRRWDKENKCWELDATSEVVELLKKIGISLDQEIINQIEELEKIKIILEGNRGYIKGKLDEQLIQLIDDELSFQPEGYEWTKAYQEGRWDGYIRLFNKRDRSFPVGLLSYVEKILKEGEKEYKIIDKRKEGEPIKLEWYGLPLREYQKEAIKVMKKHTSGLISMPTGTGKTILFLKYVQEMGKSTVIFVHRKELLYQWRDRFIKYLGIEPGIVGDNHYDERQFTIAMLQTVNRKPLKRKYDIMCIDEAHHTPADTFYRISQMVKSKYRFGLSATPWRQDGKDMLIWAGTGPIIYNVNVEDMVRQGFLAKPEFITLDYGGYIPGKDWREVQRNLIENRKRNQAIINFVEDKYKKGYRIYVDVLRVKHGKLLEEKLLERGVNAIFLSGKDLTEKRKDVLKRFEEIGDFVLISTLIKEGVDLPKMNMILLAGGGKSGIRTIQTIGRALRPKKGENKAYIIDLRDEGKYVEDHYLKRQEIMKKYYKSLYKNNVPSKIRYI